MVAFKTKKTNRDYVQQSTTKFENNILKLNLF